MNARLHACRAASIALPLLIALAMPNAHADTAKMTACAAKLTPDAKAIFDKTLPQVTPSSNLRTLLTSTTRSLAMSGSINMGNARQSATSAGQCLQLR